MNQILILVYLFKNIYGCVSCELQNFEIHLNGFYVEFKPHAIMTYSHKTIIKYLNFGKVTVSTRWKPLFLILPISWTNDERGRLIYQIQTAK